jgi:UDP-glucuronate 4-epimerase
MAIPLFTRLIDEGKPVQVFGDGSIQRDYVYVQDLADAIVGILPFVQGYEEYNVGTGGPLTLMQLISAIENGLDKEADVEFLPLSEGEAGSAYADISKIQRTINYCPKYSLERGLAKYIDWYRKEKKNHAV